MAAFLAWHHPALHADRLACWDRCWREGSTAALRDRLRLAGDPLSTDWAELERVAAFLRTQELRDGELTCFNNFTHPLLLDLGLEPTTPFVQFDTLLHAFPRRRETIRRRLEASRQQLVVSDLLAVGLHRGQATGDSAALPAGFPAAWIDLYPWTEPILFRSGRYIVHRVSGPVAPLFPEPGRRAYPVRITNTYRKDR